MHATRWLLLHQIWTADSQSKGSEHLPSPKVRVSFIGCIWLAWVDYQIDILRSERYGSVRSTRAHRQVNWSSQSPPDWSHRQVLHVEDIMTLIIFSLFGEGSNAVRFEQWVHAVFSTPSRHPHRHHQSWVPVCLPRYNAEQFLQVPCRV